jgi:hypothetical protein
MAFIQLAVLFLPSLKLLFLKRTISSPLRQELFDDSLRDHVAVRDDVRIGFRGCLVRGDIRSPKINAARTIERRGMFEPVRNSAKPESLITSLIVGANGY